MTKRSSYDDRLPIAHVRSLIDLAKTFPHFVVSRQDHFRVNGE